MFTYYAHDHGKMDRNNKLCVIEKTFFVHRCFNIPTGHEP